MSGEAPRTAVVVFGAAVRRDGGPSETMRRRVIAALRTGAALGRPLYVPTGGRGRHGPAESALMAALLAEAGVPPENVREEPTGTDTLSSARAVAALLAPEVAAGRVGAVLAVSSRYHRPRCVLLLRLAGLPARPGRPAQPGPGFRELPWWLREGAALPYDAALSLWHRARGRG